MDHLDYGRDQLKYFLRDADLLSYLETFRDILKITKVSQLKYLTNNDLATIGFTSSEKRRYQKAYEKHFPNPYFARIKGFIRRRKRQMSKKGSLPPIDIQQFTEALVKVPTKHIIAMEDITINKELGMGQFGVVQQGTWTTGNQRLQVAIKCLGQERMTSNSTEFLKEAAVMHSIEHPNIVRLYGVVLHLDTLMLVTELAPLRSLLECLREPSLRTNFSVLTLCDFAEQICDGMAYLENKRLIHRDLAARNILVFNKNKVKISDFGLSRALGVGKDYYQTNYNVNLKLPVAWCAPECILYLRFTSASDVWAFGVCLWEMFTYGFQPWAAFSGQQILEAIDSPKYQRLERPFCCSEEYYNMMLESWSHDPNKRPKFRDLTTRIRDIRPQEVQTITQFRRPDTQRRGSVLEYKAGQIITVLGKEEMTKSPMWYGAVEGGTCGLFDPKNTKPYEYTEKRLSVESLPSEPECRAAWSMANLLRSDVKRQTYTGKRSIQCDMISRPQGEVKHTSHVGLDGAHFGDISFLDPAGCGPRQFVNKPLEDLEQVPLINPNSPSQLKGLSNDRTYFPPKANLEVNECFDEINSSSANMKSGTLRKPTQKIISEPVTNRGVLNKVKSATLDRSCKIENDKVTPKSDDIHEYQEIVDLETQIPPNSNEKTDEPVNAESLTSLDDVSEFSLALMQEMESIIRAINLNKKDENNTDADISNRFIGLRKKHSLGAMKQMTAQEEKTLNTAVALANEITSKSMSDVGKKSRPAASPSDKHKRSFKFVHLALNNNAPHETDKESTGKHERRNFCDEAKAKAVDIQSTITEEGRAAYITLIEEPTPSSSHIIHAMKESLRIENASTMPKSLPFCKCNNSNLGPSTMPRPAVLPRPEIMDLSEDTNSMFLRMSNDLRNASVSTGARPKERPWYQMASQFRSSIDETDNAGIMGINPLPLPPKSSKALLVDMPRHIRKYPLKIPTQHADAFVAQSAPGIENGKTTIYQNTQKNVSPDADYITHCSNEGASALKETKEQTAPMNTQVNQSVDVPPYESDIDEDISGSLVKEHVSVEDLLEFADLKPHGRQRGIESDEVRIMMKVLNEKSTPEQCLVALDLCEWDVHHAIKLLRVKISVGDTILLEDCHNQLLKSYGDIAKAVNSLTMPKRV